MRKNLSIKLAKVAESYLEVCVGKLIYVFMEGCLVNDRAGDDFTWKTEPGIWSEICMYKCLVPVDFFALENLLVT